MYKRNDVLRINKESVFAFLRFLFYNKKLAPVTLSPYKSALGRPLYQGLNSDVGSSVLIILIRHQF